MVENKIAGILGIIAILAGFGGSLVLDSDQIDKAYVCSVNDKLALFDRLSTTGVTGYYTNSTGQEKSSVCSKGVWVKLVDYAASKGVSVEEFLASQPEEVVPEQPQTLTGNKYLCSTESCVVIG